RAMRTRYAQSGTFLWAVVLTRFHAPFLLFFFFQAEDGIRDATVTGVQTCALPIWPRIRGWRSGWGISSTSTQAELFPEKRRSSRSEERRVGKECRSRWVAYD